MTSIPARVLQAAALLALLALPVAGGRALALEAPRIEQHAKQHWEPKLQIVLSTHLDTVKRICPDLSPEARRTIAAAGKNAVAAAARQIAEMQFGGRPQQPGVATASISAAVRAALQPFASPEALQAYAEVESERRGRLDRTAQQVALTIIDDRLLLSATQRDAIAADLQKQWQPGWGGATNTTMMNNQLAAPDFAHKCIVPHLDERQQAEWKTWCEQAGMSRFGMQAMVVWPGQHGLDISGLKADPWWAP